jgi:hypothetical protein
MSQAPQSNVTAATTDRAPDGATAVAEDHLARLHKMSTTAGVTNVDYVAVNHTAIAAVLLGLLSLLSFFGYLLLLIPIVGVVFAVIALRQITASNGTQTGRGLALLGLLMSVAFGGAAIAKEGIAVARVKGDESGIASTLDKVGEAVRQGKYEDAYGLFDTDFKKNVKPEVFKSRWEEIVRGSLGKLELFEWNGITPYFESAEGHKMAATKVRTKFEKGTEDRFDVILRETDGRWLISQLKGFFPEAAPAPAGGGGKPGSGGKSNDVFNF